MHQLSVATKSIISSQNNLIGFTHLPMAAEPSSVCQKYSKSSHSTTRTKCLCRLISLSYSCPTRTLGPVALHLIWDNGSVLPMISHGVYRRLGFAAISKARIVCVQPGAITPERERGGLLSAGGLRSAGGIS